MMKKTALYEVHVSAGGKMVDFSGWSLPIHYGSQLKEHHTVRNTAGLFDVSHMTILDCSGRLVEEFLSRVLANDVSALTVNAALYSVLLNEQGGVIDDLIVYRLQDKYRLVTNASTRDKVLHWLDLQNMEGVAIEERGLAMIAVQGPDAVGLMNQWHESIEFDALPSFSCVAIDQTLVARTGYTGEDGFEVMLPEENAAEFWHFLTERGAEPAGLGARDTLRLEAGLNLYGHEMDEEINPLAANLGWTIKWKPGDRKFVGRQALERSEKKVDEQLVGLILDGKGVLRQGQRVLTSQGEGLITSGSYGPTINCSIALARLPKLAEMNCEVEIRGKLVPSRIVPLPFVRRGKILVDTE